MGGLVCLFFDKEAKDYTRLGALPNNLSPLLNSHFSILAIFGNIAFLVPLGPQEKLLWVVVMMVGGGAASIVALGDWEVVKHLPYHPSGHVFPVLKTHFAIT